jgi:hypothetical protein
VGFLLLSKLLKIKKLKKYFKNDKRKSGQTGGVTFEDGEVAVVY